MENQLRLLVWNSEPEGKTTVAQVALPITVWVLRSDERILEQALAKKHPAPL